MSKKYVNQRQLQQFWFVEQVEKSGDYDEDRRET